MAKEDGRRPHPIEHDVAPEPAGVSVPGDGTHYFAADNLTGWSARFPEGGCAPLDEIRAEKWTTFEPQPVRILAAHFIRVNSWKVPCYLELKLGEFIQGLLASINHHRRMYVVTVPAPAEYAEGPDCYICYG